MYYDNDSSPNVLEFTNTHTCSHTVHAKATDNTFNGSSGNHTPVHCLPGTLSSPSSQSPFSYLTLTLLGFTTLKT